MLDFSKLRLSQPSSAGSWADLGKNRQNSAQIVPIPFSSFLPWESEFRFDYFFLNDIHVKNVNWLATFCLGYQRNDHNPTLILLWFNTFKPTSSEYFSHTDNNST